MSIYDNYCNMLIDIKISYYLANYVLVGTLNR